MFFLEEGKRYIPFRLVDEQDQPITQASLNQFQIYFLRDNQACTDSLTLENRGQGRYALVYTPSSAGHDYLEAYHASSGIRIVDVEKTLDGIQFFTKVFGAGVTVYDLYHNYSGQDRYQIQVKDPQTYTLYVYRSSDWLQQKRTVNDAQGSTALDSDGRWLNKISVIAGQYHFVIQKFRENIVVFSQVEVPA